MESDGVDREKLWMSNRWIVGWVKCEKKSLVGEVLNRSLCMLLVTAAAAAMKNV